jgi:hypothetical protein
MKTLEQQEIVVNEPFALAYGASTISMLIQI